MWWQDYTNTACHFHSLNDFPPFSSVFPLLYFKFFLLKLFSSYSFSVLLLLHWPNITLLQIFSSFSLPVPLFAQVLGPKCQQFTSSISRTYLELRSTLDTAIDSKWLNIMEVGRPPADIGLTLSSFVVSFSSFAFCTNLGEEVFFSTRCFEWTLLGILDK